MQPISPPAWVTFRTGVNPGKHGVFDFHTLRIDRPLTPAPFRSVPYPSFWEILAEQRNAEVCVVNVPCTFPAKQIRGRMIAGFPVVGPMELLTYPADLMAEIERNVGNYLMDVRSNLGGGAPASHEEFINELMEMVQSRAQTAHYLLSKYPWDLGVIVFTAPDRAQNIYWQYADPNDPRLADAEREQFGNVILRIYQMLDDFLNEALNLLGDNGMLLVMSDHGFGPMFKNVNVNRWLADEGFLVPRQDISSRIARLKRSAKGTLKQLLPLPIVRAIRRYRNAIRVSDTISSPSIADQMLVDWAQTRAFALGKFGNIVINLKGREPYGVVEPGEEYEAIRSAIADRLLSWRNPATGKRMIKRVYRREDLYEGPFLEQAPDLLLEWEDYGYVGFRPTSPHKPILVDPSEGSYRHLGWSGNHRPNGILIAHGPEVRSGYVIEGAHIQDLAPTILYYMLQTVPDHMDGRVLCEMFTQQFVAEHPVRFEHILSTVEGETETPLTDSERRDLEEHLRALGYL